MPAIRFVSRRLSPVQAVLPMTAPCSSRGRRAGRPGGDAPVSEAAARAPWTGPKLWHLHIRLLSLCTSPNSTTSRGEL
eukprot:1577341-Prymnesium_polylepis.1